MSTFYIPGNVGFELFDVLEKNQQYTMYLNRFDLTNNKLTMYFLGHGRYKMYHGRSMIVVYRLPLKKVESNDCSTDILCCVFPLIVCPVL